MKFSRQGKVFKTHENTRASGLYICLQESMLRKQNRRGTLHRVGVSTTVAYLQNPSREYSGNTFNKEISYGRRSYKRNT